MSRASDHAYTTIRGGILSGELSPGVQLVEETLAVHCGVSRTPIPSMYMSTAGKVQGRLGQARYASQMPSCVLTSTVRVGMNVAGLECHCGKWRVPDRHGCPSPAASTPWRTATGLRKAGSVTAYVLRSMVERGSMPTTVKRR